MTTPARATQSPTPVHALRWIVRLLVRWFADALTLSGPVALFVLWAEADDPSQVLADPSARLRWVLTVGGVLAVLKLWLDRPISEPLFGRGLAQRVRTTLTRGRHDADAVSGRRDR